MRKTGVNIAVDMRELADFIGTTEALLDKKNIRYLDDVLDVALREADQEFNLAAAATAAADGFRHMFEWGTVGINDERTNLRPRPDEERARLWKNVFVGSNGKRMLSYTFKPSIAYVPKPTRGKTGMSTDVISSLKSHTFVWKALVLESGSQVNIRPKSTNESKRLLIPYYPGGGPALFSKYDKKRGYTITTGPHIHRPGRTGGTAGNFTKFWEAYWNGPGSQTIERSIEKQITTDYSKQLRFNKSYGFVATTSNSLGRMISSEKGKVTRMLNASARARKLDADE